VIDRPAGSIPTPPAARPGAFFVVEGPGFASGRPNRVDVEFRPAGGRWLDVAGGPRVSLEGMDFLAEGRCSRGAGVGPLEHMVSGLAIAGWNHWLVRAEHADLPLLDGSADPWHRGALSCGAGGRIAVGEVLVPGGRWSGQEGCGRIEIRPAAVFRLDVGWSRGPLPEERWTGGLDDLERLVPARTFIDVESFLAVRASGTMAGVGPGSGRLLAGDTPRRSDALRLAAEIGADPADSCWTGGAERLAAECAAHKALDLVGDILLWLGYLPRLDVTARDAGHVLHHRLGKALRSFSASAMPESPCP